MLLVGFIPGPSNPKDLDSFVFPLIQEFVQLGIGVPDVWNSARSCNFTLRAHISVVGADMPGREKLMNFKGNRGTSYCPYCYVHGVHNRGIYCPLDPPDNPPDTIKEDIVSEWRTYDPSNLPIRTDEQSRRIANHVLETGDDKAAKKYGIKGPSCLSDLTSIDIPRSFPPDAMHLWWENIIPDLVEHWRGKFFTEKATVDILETSYDADSEPVDREDINSRKLSKKRKISKKGTRKGKGKAAKKGSVAQPVKRFVKTDDPYNIAPEEWHEIGKDSAASAATVPALFGDPVRDFAEHCHHLKAAEWKIFTFLLAPIYLKRRLPDKDYDEFLNLVDALHLSCDYEITENEIMVVEERLRRFVTYYEARYYAKRWEKLPACLPVFHQVLHVAQGIRWAGPMYVYWQWPMERVCGMIAGSAKSRVSANRNMAISIVQNEQRNHLPYVVSCPDSGGAVDELED